MIPVCAWRIPNGANERTLTRTASAFGRENGMFRRMSQDPVSTATLGYYFRPNRTMTLSLCISPSRSDNSRRVLGYGNYRGTNGANSRLVGLPEMRSNTSLLEVTFT